MSKRNHWYDYLWVLTALYLALGFFNILFAWLGLLCFFIPLIMASTFGTKSYCSQILRPRAAVRADRQQLEAFAQTRYPFLATLAHLPLWFLTVFYSDVCQYAGFYLSGFYPCYLFSSDSQPAVDF